MRRIIMLTAIIGIIFTACFSLSSPTPERILKFPKNSANELGQIDKLKVRIVCGYISSLRNIPELYNIEMGYEIPTENLLEARPRLGAAAVDLPRWDGVIAVISDSDDCFSVNVEVEGRTDKILKWTDRQLGLTK